MSAETATLGELRDFGRRQLGPAEHLEVDVLLTAACDQNQTALTAFPERTVHPEQAACFRDWIAQRRQGTPVAYLTGEREFWTLRLRVTPDVLIPRPETEHLVEQSLAHLPGSPARVLDAGTGSGAVALALASERPGDSVTALDACPRALRVAAANREQLQLSNVALLNSNWLAALQPLPRWHLIASNPPYLDQHDHHLGQGDLRFEPRHALSDEADGLDAIRTLANQAWPRLLEGAWLMLEHGYQQAESVRACLRVQGFRNVTSWRDLAGHERVTGGQR